MNKRKRIGRVLALICSSVGSRINAVGVTLGTLTASRRQTIFAIGRLTGFFALGLAIMLLLWNQVIRFEHRSSDQDQDLVILASYPRYLPTDDQGGIVITVVNTGQHAITDTVVSLVCGHSRHVCMGIGGTSRVDFGCLEPDERKTKLVRFQVNRIDSFFQKVQIDLKLSIQRSNGTPMTTVLRVEPTVVSFLPIGVSSLVLSQTFTIPNLVVAVAATVAVVKSVAEAIKNTLSRSA